MPSGNTHDKITLVTVIPYVMILFLVTKDLLLSIIAGLGYLFSSLMFNGDLDTNSKPFNRWWLFKVIWIPYQMLFTHRSVYTHGIIIGTLIRLVYISPLVYLLLVILNVNLLDYLSNYHLLFFIIGLELGNTTHTLTDKTF